MSTKKKPATGAVPKTAKKARTFAIHALPLLQCLGMAHEKNPKEHDIGALIASFKRFGFTSPPMIDEATGVMVAGHGRCEALEQMQKAGDEPPDGIVEKNKEWYVPVIRGVSFAGERERDAYVIADNQHVINGGWNFERLTSMLVEFRDEGVAYEGLGFQDVELDNLLGNYVPENDGPNQVDVEGHKRTIGGVTDDTIPELPKVPITKPGDIWTLGEHTLWCGDSRANLDHLELAFGEARAAIAITSPPYASQRKYDEATAFKPVAPDDYVAWFDAVQENVRRVLAPDGSWFLNIRSHCDDGQRSLYVYDLVIEHVRKWKWRFVDDFCWRNTRNGTPGGWNNRFKNAHEPVYHFALNAQIKFRPEAVSTPTDAAFSGSSSMSGSGSGLLGRHTVEPGMARPSNVIEASAESSQGDHPAPFPIMLPAFFIAAFSDEGDVVYEPFCGSGTTLIAATQLERRCVGVEVSPGYCDVIVERWQQLSGKKAVRRKRARG